MYTITETDTYSNWFDGLRDPRAKARILTRLRRVELGNLGDHKSLGDGVSELRLTYGPGYRLYYTRRGEEIILLLAGGDKSTQTRDIKLAKELLQALNEETP